MSTKEAEANDGKNKDLLKVDDPYGGDDAEKASKRVCKLILPSIFLKKALSQRKKKKPLVNFLWIFKRPYLKYLTKI
jgi:hypothetical protein